VIASGDPVLGARFPRVTRPVVHCQGQSEAEELLVALKQRFQECLLELNPEKTQIVCYLVARQRDSGLAKQFEFLGYCFRPRLACNRKGELFVIFSPVISPSAGQKIRQRVGGWRLKRRTDLSLVNIARLVNLIVRGGSTTMARTNDQRSTRSYGTLTVTC